MAISTQDAVKAKRLAFSLLQTLGLSSSASQALSTLFQELAQKKGNPNLQVVVVDLQTSAAADVVVADAACKIYGIFVKKTNATGAWLKGSDHATVASSTAAEFAQEFNAALQEVAVTYPNGFAQGTGWTMGADTTASGTTNSTAGDGPKGFVILGAA